MAGPTTELGNKQLHERHSVMIEGGTIARARVMDQLVIDKMLAEGMLSAGQHRVAEEILSLAVESGFYASAPPLEGSTSSLKGTKVPSKVFSYARKLRPIRRRYGRYGEYLVQEVIVHNWDITNDEVKMKVFLACLSHLDAQSFIKNPIRHLTGRPKKV